MKNFRLAIILSALPFLVLSACEKSQKTSDSRPEPVATSAPPPPPPQPQQLSLYMVPLNPSEFSMQAIQANKKKIETMPDDVEALVGLGDANIMISRYEVARDFFERAVKADGNHINANISLANCYVFLQKTDEALRRLDLLLSAHPDNPEGLFNKGLILLKSKQTPGGAKEAWQRLIDKHPEHPLAQRVQPEMGRL